VESHGNAVSGRIELGTRRKPRRKVKFCSTAFPAFQMLDAQSPCSSAAIIFLYLRVSLSRTNEASRSFVATPIIAG